VWGGGGGVGGGGQRGGAGKFHFFREKEKESAGPSYCECGLRKEEGGIHMRSHRQILGKQRGKGFLPCCYKQEKAMARLPGTPD